MFLRDIDALLVSDPINIRYLTGFVGLSPVERESYLLFTSNEAFLFTSSLYLEQARKLRLSNCFIVKLVKTHKPLQIIEFSREKPLTDGIKQVVGSSLWQNLKLGFEEIDLRVSEFRKFERELNGIILIPTQNRIEEIRKVKLLEEIVLIKHAAEITDACFNFILKKLKPEVTESQITWEIETFFHNRGAESAFSPIVAFGANSSQPHYTSSANCHLQSSDTVLVDFGARVDGYCADMTRVVFLGKPDAEQEKAYQTLKTTQKYAIELLELGERSGARLDRAVREKLAYAGYQPYPHSLGHSLGLAIHEGPRLSVSRDEILKPGHVITIEPGIYLEGKFGIRIEDLVLIKENGIEVLSKSPKELTLL